MKFVWEHYPSYSECPEVIFEWLINEARRIAYEDELTRQAETSVCYQNQNTLEWCDTEDSEEEKDTTFGPAPQKKS
jgi:hypothetical protein